MISISTEQGVALYLQKEQAETDNQQSILESLVGRPVITRCDWADAMSIARSQTVSIFVFELGIEPTVSELEKLRTFSLAQPDAIRVGLYTPYNIFNRTSYGSYCHRLIKRNIESSELQTSIQDASRAKRLLGQDKIRNYIEELDLLPQFPAISSRLADQLAQHDCNVRTVAKIISKENKIAEGLISQVNNACFILQKNISKPQEAIDIIGTRQSHYMILANQIFEQLPQKHSWSSFAFEHIRERSLLVAGLTQEICRSIKAPTEVADQAFLASLLQDLGLLVFASNLADDYQRIMQEAADLKQPLYAIEKLRLRVSHAEAGAFLLSQWDLPPAVVDAVLFHHFPMSSKNGAFSALTALHVADAILPNVTNVLGCQISSRLNMEYLKRLGLEHRVNQWQKIAAGYKTSHPGCGGVVCSFA